MRNNPQPGFINPDLLKHLETVFPDKLPTAKEFSPEDILIRMGSVKVVNYLKALAQEQSGINTGDE